LHRATVAVSLCQAAAGIGRQFEVSRPVMASAKNLDELRESYHRWCLDRLAEDRLDCCRVPVEFHVLCERDEDVSRIRRHD
jgi:hypothetical protein